MFTGLIETTGSIVSRAETAGATRLVVAAPSLAGRWHIGDSIAVSGVCLTALDAGRPDDFAADLAAETLARTNLAAVQAGDVVNLELPTPAGSPLGGHVVQGHVDAVGRLVSLLPLKPDLAATDWRMTLELPPQLVSSVVSQGSITINGISLTVAAMHGQQIEIAVIPHTYAATNLHALAPGALLNIETDVLARYAAQQKTPVAEDWLTPAYLLANGY